MRCTGAQAGEREGDEIFYTDKRGGRDHECLSLGCDHAPVLDGRTPLQTYADFIGEFARQCQANDLWGALPWGILKKGKVCTVCRSPPMLCLPAAGMVQSATGCPAAIIAPKLSHRVGCCIFAWLKRGALQQAWGGPRTACGTACAACSRAVHVQRDAQFTDRGVRAARQHGHGDLRGHWALRRAQVPGVPGEGRQVELLRCAPLTPRRSPPPAAHPHAFVTLPAARAPDCAGASAALGAMRQYYQRGAAVRLCHAFLYGMEPPGETLGAGGEITIQRGIPGIGEFQCYDGYMMKDLKRAAEEVSEPEWCAFPPSHGTAMLLLNSVGIGRKTLGLSQGGVDLCWRCRGDPPRDGAGSYDFAPWETGAALLALQQACDVLALLRQCWLSDLYAVQSSSRSPTQPAGCSPTAASSWWAATEPDSQAIHLVCMGCRPGCPHLTGLQMCALL